MYLSDGSSFSVPEALTRSERLVPGRTLSAADIEQLQQSAQQLRVRDKALSLLSRLPHSTQGLRQKLLQRGFRLDAVETVLNELSEQHLLDDRGYAEHWIRSRLDRHPEGRTALCLILPL